MLHFKNGGPFPPDMAAIPQGQHMIFPIRFGNRIVFVNGKLE
jgi:hypothetical protein